MIVLSSSLLLISFNDFEALFIYLFILLNYLERAFAFVFREVKQCSSTADGASLKRKAGIFMCGLEDDKHIDLIRDYSFSWIFVLLLLAVDILISTSSYFRLLLER